MTPKVSVDDKIRPGSDGKLDVSHFWNVLCADKMWRMHNLYWIKDRHGNRVKFRPNETQMEFIRNMHTRNIILKARQRGFTTLIQLWMLDECLFRPNTNGGVIAHTKEDAENFFSEKIKFAYDNLAPFVKSRFGARNDTIRQMRFLNGSTITVSTSLRSGTYQYLHVSEYGKLSANNPKRADEVKSGSFPTVPVDGFIFVESTAEGRIGNFFNMCQKAQKAFEEGQELTKLDFKFHFFPWHREKSYVLDVPLNFSEAHKTYFEDLRKRGIRLTAAQKAWYVKTEETQGDLMKREFPSYPDEAFENALEGAYFTAQMRQIRSKGQIWRVPIDPYIPVHTFWDLGRDTTAIWFFQEVGLEYRFVDYYQNSGESILHYIDVLKMKKDGDEPYRYGVCFLPHDGSRKTLATDKSIAEILYENRFEVDVVRRSANKDHSILKARRVLPLCWFDKVKCKDGLACLDAYRKEKDEKLGVWKQRPLHDAASHGADAFMTFSDGYAFTPKEPNQDYMKVHDTYSPTPHGRNAMTGY